jgi:hypothetical protein
MNRLAFFPTETAMRLWWRSSSFEAARWRGW